MVAVVGFAATGYRLLWPVIFVILVGRSLLIPDGSLDAVRTLFATAIVAALLVARGGALRADLALMPAAALLGLVEAGSARFRDRERRRAVADRRVADQMLAIDPLTNLANRRQLRVVLAARSEAASPTGCGILLLDIDHFKRINDTFGHLAGDAILVEVARRLALAAPPTATVARFGGEEFVVVLDVETREELVAAGNAIRGAIGRTPFLLPHGATITVDASAGVALASSGHPWLADRLLDDADRALYAAKRRGRARLHAAWELDGLDQAEPDTDLVRLGMAVSTAIGVRDPAGPLHDLHVSELSATIARRLALRPDEVLACRLAGLLHDVGKVALPDAILHHAGVLEPAEWLQVRGHPEVGALLIGQVAGLEIAIPGVRHHHERWDGSGYPAGLVGDAIPIVARIVAVADAFSAVTTDRPHRHARPRHVAIEELRDGRGRQFDPAVVDAALDLLDERHAERRMAL